MYNESYICNCSGSNTTCFRFFSGHGFDSSEIVEAVVLTVVFMVSLASNMLVVYVTHAMRRSPGGSVTNYFVANLAMADLLFALTIPSVIVTRVANQWTMGSAGCKITIYLQCLSGSVVMWSLCLISIDRFRLIVVPPFRPRFTPRKVALIVGCSWITLMVLYSPLMILFDQEYGHDGTDTFSICTMVPKYGASYGIVFISVITTTVFLLPSIILIYNYVQIYRKLTEMMMRQRQQRARFSTVAVTTNDSLEQSSDVSSGTLRQNVGRDSTTASTSGQDNSTATLSNQEQRRPNGLWSRAKSFPTLTFGRVVSLAELRSNQETLPTASAPNSSGSDSCLSADTDPPDRHLRALRLLVLEVVAYLIMWLPLTVLMTVMYFESELECYGRSVASHHFFYCLLLAYANTCVNPILYGVLNDNFRDTFRNQMLSRCQPTFFRCRCGTLRLWWQRLIVTSRTQPTPSEFEL